MLNLEVWKNYEFLVPAAGVAANIAISPDVPSNFRFEVAGLYAAVDASTSVSGGVSIRVGFAAATLPAQSSVAATPAEGILMSHSGTTAGLHGLPGMGAKGEELRATVENPTGGAVTISFLGRPIQV